MGVKKMPYNMRPNGRRHKKLRDNIMGITRPAIRRLARRGGVARMKMEIYPTARGAAKQRLTEIIQQVVYVLDSGGRRKVVTSRDVVYALKRMGNTIYGFDDNK